MTRIVYPDWMSPFEIAFYSVDDDIIYIDKKLKGTPELKRVIEHEMGHAKSNKIFDAELEFKNSSDPMRALLKYKPLFIFVSLCPITLARHKDKWIIGIEYLRTLFIALCILFALFVFFVF